MIAMMFSALIHLLIVSYLYHIKHTKMMSNELQFCVTYMYNARDLKQFESTILIDISFSLVYLPESMYTCTWPHSQAYVHA